MKTTLNYPTREWYSDGMHMNTTYWPMDYPPLCAYAHYGMALIVNKVTPEAVELDSPAGYNGPLYRSMMRLALILLELVVFVPAAIRLLTVLNPKASTTTRRLYLFMLLTLPPLVFVDHGHFQPNSAMHGLVLWGTYFLLTGRPELAVIAMVGAINFKQMAFYFSLPFAVYTLSALARKAANRYKGDRIKQVGYLVLRCAGLAAVFAITMGVLWYPWVMESLYGNPDKGVSSVLARIFPVRRGLFEDKVATFWCVLNNFIKVRDVLS
jgi:alpha-1,3-glucosyltransferase